ncbi:GntR family transcriptional regulator [Bradyrhizobium sp. NP1]|uniref:GntR family transcriptional regulator n=1 Tax=Bradyrhizobium sp. NP1 TaxID=3049772 RepID=UPI0025A56826|nr:GntR family transcriptional regulator [Bradyrhizobium sp. NP1]WJR79241.1 FCD domain-containing protein [Bradyrhizobium sp. NP1]
MREPVRGGAALIHHSGPGEKMRSTQYMDISSEFLLSDKAPKTLSEAVYLRLRHDILSGELKPGTKLRFADLTNRYGAAMGTLRESLSRLTADRLVVAEGQRGFRVPPISLNELWDITQLRIEIETVALSESIKAGTSDWEADVLAALHRLLKLEGPRKAKPALLTEKGAFLHKRFHMSLVNASPSIWRLRVIEVLYDQSERYRRLQTSYLSGMLNSAQEHQAMADAAISRDTKTATRLLKIHLSKTAEMLASLTELWVEH